MNKELTARLDKAGKVLDKADGLLAQMLKKSELRSKGNLDKEFAPIQEAIEEAQQLLFDEQDEQGDSLPDPDEELFPEEGAGSGSTQTDQGSLEVKSEEDEPEVDPVMEQYLARKTKLEQRSREIEAKAYEGAARRLDPGLEGTTAATEEQEKLIAFAVSALEAHFMAEPDPVMLVRIAELEVCRREVKKAKAYLAKALELDPESKPAQDLLERIHSDPKIKDKSKCFIATAAMGSADASEVKTLRAFRDQVLMKHGAGRLLVAAYYEVSPPLAKVLERNETLRNVTARYFIQPLAQAARKVPGVE